MTAARTMYRFVMSYGRRSSAHVDHCEDERQTHKGSSSRLPSWRRRSKERSKEGDPVLLVDVHQLRKSDDLFGIGPSKMRREVALRWEWSEGGRRWRRGLRFASDRTREEGEHLEEAR